jgi:hypothetical protein
MILDGQSLDVGHVVARTRTLARIRHPRTEA